MYDVEIAIKMADGRPVAVRIKGLSPQTTVSVETIDFDDEPIANEDEESSLIYPADRWDELVNVGFDREIPIGVY